MSPPDLGAYAAQTATKYGIPKSLFLAMGGQESGGRETSGGHVVTSPSGARGWGQLMPQTAKSLGVNPDDPYQNIEGAARYLKQQYDTFGSWRLALAAYNAGPGAVHQYDGVPPYQETQNYVRNILAKAGVLAPTDSHWLPTDTVGVTPPHSVVAPPVDLLGQSENTGLQALATGTYDPTKQLQGLEASVAPIHPLASAGATSSLPADTTNVVKTWVKLAKGADRPGVSTQPAVLRFFAGIASAYGKPLTIGTGSNHNEYTVDGNVSDHWTGHAADIPATGLALRQLGYLALIRAGMPQAEALKAKRTGGLFNVGGYQIIFATKQGGNHFNHLHVGVRG